MIHCRIDCEDDEDMNSKRRFACGIGPDLPPGDTYYFQGDALADYKVDCPGCNPGGPRQLGTPLSELTPARFRAIGESWGYP